MDDDAVGDEVVRGRFGEVVDRLDADVLQDSRPDLRVGPRRSSPHG